MNPAALPTWRMICRSVNLLALGTSLLSLSQRRCLPFQPRRIGEMGGNPGYLHGLFRCLDSLGWVERRGPEGSPTMEVELSAEGHQELADLESLAPVGEWLLQGEDFLRGEFAAWSEGPPAGGLAAETLRAARLGPLVLHCLLHPEQDLPDGPRALLRGLQWQDAAGQWTPRGRTGLALGPVFHYPFAYLKTLLAADQLLFGDSTQLRDRSQGTEHHVDRERDILFSGQVFTGSVAETFWELFLPIFQGPRPPRAVVDLGCGDGLMLAELGARLDSSVMLIGMEYNEVARQTAARTLARFPHHQVVPGDIGDPKDLMARLAALELSPQDVLFVTKSVIHNRPYRASLKSPQPALGATAVAGVDGQPILSAELEASLVDFFKAWKGVLGPHGLLAVEAHAVPCAVARRHAGRTLAPCLELTHCYSNQLLVEAEVHRQCARRAGLHSAQSRELGTAAFGHPHMTLDHWRVAV